MSDKLEEFIEYLEGLPGGTSRELRMQARAILGAHGEKKFPVVYRDFLRRQISKTRQESFQAQEALSRLKEDFGL